MSTHIQHMNALNGSTQESKPKKHNATHTN